RMVSNSRFRNPDFDDYSLEYAYMEESPIHGIGQIRFTKDGSDDVMAHQFQYDAAGYLVRSTNGPAAMGENDLDRIYSWDALGRLESVTNAVGTTNFQYDHGRGRIKKTGPSGETVTYIGSIAEVTTTGMTKHIFAGAMRIATIQPEGQKCFYMTDHLQSSTLITDESGEVLQRMDYEPYGAMIENSRSQNSKGLRHTFTGRESDGETRLLYCGARYYDPVVGMFISPDQLIPNSDDPQLFNRYAYARNNPMVYSDPSGEFPWLFVILGVVLGATMAAATAVPAYMSGQISLGQMIGLILLGGLAGGVGGGLSGAIPAAYTGASTAIQIILGTVGGIVGGAASGFISSMGASLILGDSISEALDKGMWGTIGGAIVGGIGSFLGSSFGAAYSNSIANPAMMSFSQKFWKLAVSQLGKQSFNFVNAGINYSLNLALEKGR
ncbi:MAG: RHS repeat domain-containing protein, partial [Candidatus Sumerlaeia bacterium]